MTPLSQFEIIVFRPFVVFFDFSFTNFTFFLVLNSFLILFFFWPIFFQANVIPHTWQYLVEKSFSFLLSIFQTQVVGRKGFSYFPIIFIIFFFILFSNLVGLLPFSFTVTSHFIVTLFFALSFNLSFLILGLYLDPRAFVNLFIPSNISPFLIPLVSAIELLSYFIRTLSLSVRLFANMMAGHTLLFILSSFVISSSSISIFVSFIPLLLVIGVIILEFGIAFLQAYVFVVLLCIYLNDSFNPGH